MAQVCFLFVPLILQRKEFQRLSLKFLQTLLKHSPVNTREMKEICGYELLARLLRKEHWILVTNSCLISCTWQDESLLSVIFEMVGLKKSPRVYTFTTGVVSNFPAFQHLLLDWQIWRRASFGVQQILFKTLAELVSSHEHSKFHVQQLRQAKALEQFFHIFKEYDVPLSLGPYFITIIRSLMSDPPTRNDLLVNVLPFRY